MTNILNAILVNQSINPSNGGDTKPFFNISSDGKVKPKEYKGKLLPSRIFGSPIEYAKDLKKDVVSIGKAAKGQANDYELGRINDLAMKAGSLGLAAYLFVKNPLKLSKAMEIAGFGTFFASMALWPKLAIQAPLKARTGVDIHQKYIDSQGRKKMLFQDPQYNLTDLFSKEDLDKMGKKLKVSENLPDRDSFIKQRAKKTAVQGNTLWMLSAGFASPIMSALACNALETPINNAFEKSALDATEKAFKSGESLGLFNKLRTTNREKTLMKFLEQNANQELTDKMLNKIVNQMMPDVNSAELTSTIKQTLQETAEKVKTASPISMEFITNTLKDVLPEDFVSKLSDRQKAMLNKTLQTGNPRKTTDLIVDFLAKNEGLNSIQKHQKLKEVSSKLMQEIKTRKVTLSDISSENKTLNSSIKDFANDKKIIDEYNNEKSDVFSNNNIHTYDNTMS